MMAKRAQRILAVIIAAIVVVPSMFFGGWTLLAASARAAVSVEIGEQPYSCSDSAQSTHTDEDGTVIPIIAVNDDLDCTLVFTVLNKSVTAISLQSANFEGFAGSAWGVTAESMAGVQTTSVDGDAQARFGDPIVIAGGDSYEFEVALGEWVPSCPSGEGWGATYSAPAITASAFAIAGVLETDTAPFGFESGSCSRY